MKRYIRASYDNSMPDWLRGQEVLNELKENYAMAEAKFYSKPQPNCITIYLLKTAYVNTTKRNWRKRYPETIHTEVTNYAYCPESSADISILVGDTYYRPQYNMNKSAVKSTFDSLVRRKTYMVAPLRSDVRSEHYEDPRSTEGPSYIQRDKSGYRIPDPHDLYSRLYAKFPDKANSKLESIMVELEDYYNIINDCKDRVFDIDIRKGKGYEAHPRNKNLDIFNDVIRYYGYIYRQCEDITKSDFDAKLLTSVMENMDILEDKVNKLTNALDA